MNFAIAGLRDGLEYFAALLSLHMTNMNRLNGKYRAYRASLKGVEWRRLFVFVPGALLCMLAVAVFLAPRLVMFFVATLLFCVGLLACFVAYKVLQWKARVDQVMRQFDGRVMIQAVNIQPERQEAQVDSKKIVFH